MTLENIENHLAFACECGSVKFNLLKSGKIECTCCGKQEFQWSSEILHVQKQKEQDDG